MCKILQENLKLPGAQHLRPHNKRVRNCIRVPDTVFVGSIKSYKNAVSLCLFMHEQLMQHCSHSPADV